MPTSKSLGTGHGIDRQVAGPGLREIAKKYPGHVDPVDGVAGKSPSGGSGARGATPMPAQALSPEGARTLAHWIAGGARG